MDSRQMGMELFYQGHRMIELGNDEPVQEHLRIRVAVDPASKIRFHESFSLNYAGVRINSHENAAGRPVIFRCTSCADSQGRRKQDYLAVPVEGHQSQRVD